MFNNLFDLTSLKTKPPLVSGGLVCPVHQAAKIAFLRSSVVFIAQKSFVSQSLHYCRGEIASSQPLQLR